MVFQRSEEVKDVVATVRKTRFFFWAVIIAILNPIFSGLIVGLVMMAEPDLKREGRIVVLFSIAWGLIATLLFMRFGHLLPTP